jgi:hypothetical protein
VPLKHVEKIEVRKAPRLTFYFKETLVHRLRWRIFFKDGTVQDVSTFGDSVTVNWGRTKPFKSLKSTILEELIKAIASQNEGRTDTR